MLFNFILDHIIPEMNLTNMWYTLGKNVISGIACANDTTIIAWNEDDLYKLHYHFHLTSQKYIMQNSLSKFH